MNQVPARFTLMMILILPLFYSFASAEVLVKLQNLQPEEIRFAGFQLDVDGQVEVEFKARSPREVRYRASGFNAWILEIDSRELVWQLSDFVYRDDYDRKVSFNKEIDLKAGSYEVYVSTFPAYSRGTEINGFGEFMSYLFHSIFDDDEYYYSAKAFKDLEFTISGTGKVLTEQELAERNRKQKDRALVSFTQLQAEEYEEFIFRTEAPLDLRVYAIGEARRDGNFDFSRIINLKTREQVWQMDYRDSEHAGGARKNRMINSSLHLDRGVYKLLAVTDDSHHYQSWNSAPPYDPEYWGVTLWLENEKDRALVKETDYDEFDTNRAIIEFTRVGDDEYLVEGFSLKKPLDIHIYALGEGSDGDMYDYGWIVDARTHKKVWKMRFRDTGAAGGAAKNRLSDEVVHLEAGDYMAYYMTDDSHSYEDWNDAPPYDQKRWGMQLYVLDDSFRPGDISEYIPDEDRNVLARINRVGDDERIRKRFTLEKDSYIHIYALGEGLGGEMYDFAWIEEANTGDVVWEMNYRKTERAGGARKNRLFNDDIFLEAGEYYVIYESDDSHSFRHWNDRPPEDAVNWGVILTLSDNQQ